MADDAFDTLELAGRRVPDYSWETDNRGVKFQEELPGTYEVGFLHQGVFRAIVSFPAAGLLADIERAKKDEAAQAPQASAPAPAEQPQAPSSPPAETSSTPGEPAPSE